MKSLQCTKDEIQS